MVTVVINLFISLLNIAIGLIAFLQARTKKSAFIFLCIVFCATVWSVFISLIELTNNLQLKTEFARLSFVGPTLLPLFLTLFVKEFPVNIKIAKSKILERTIIILISFITIAFEYFAVFTAKFIKSAYIVDGQIKYEYGDLYIIYFVIFAGSLIVLLNFLYTRFRRSNGIDRLRLKFIFLGFSITTFISISTNLLAPILGNDEISKLGPISTIFLFLFTGYSIIAHRLFDIGTFVAKLLEPLVVGTFFFLVVFFVRTFQLKILQIDFYNPISLTIDYICCIVVALMISRVVNVTSNILNSFFANKNIDISLLLKDLEDALGSSISSEATIQNFNQVAKKHFPRSSFEFVNIHSNEVDSKLLKNITIDELSKIINKSSIFFSQENQDSLGGLLSINNIAIVAKISEDHLMLVSGKYDGKVYNKLELESLEIVIGKLRTVWERIKLHKQTEDFNNQLQQKVEEKTSELQEQLRKERDMMDILGHELRTPLSIGRNAISMIEMELKTDSGKTIEKEKIQALLDKAIDNLRREVKILETVLSSTRLENNKVQVNFQNINLREVINTTIEAFKAEAQKKSIKLLIAMPDNDMFVYSGREQLQEILDNLVSNAVKYTKQGSITVEVEERDKDICINVIDTGEGIPAEEIPKLGKKFYRVNPYLESSIDNVEKVVRPGGTGIGLYVVFGLAGLLNGRIDIKSEVGKGSTFTLVVPKAKMIKPTLKLGSN